MAFVRVYKEISPLIPDGRTSQSPNLVRQYQSICNAVATDTGNQVRLTSSEAEEEDDRTSGDRVPLKQYDVPLIVGDLILRHVTYDVKGNRFRRLILAQGRGTASVRYQVEDGSNTVQAGARGEPSRKSCDKGGGLHAGTDLGKGYDVETEELIARDGRVCRYH